MKLIDKNFESDNPFLLVEFKNKEIIVQSGIETNRLSADFGDVSIAIHANACDNNKYLTENEISEIIAFLKTNHSKIVKEFEEFCEIEEFGQLKKILCR